jgi:hypothetical protein
LFDAPAPCYGARFPSLFYFDPVLHSYSVTSPLNR